MSSEVSSVDFDNFDQGFGAFFESTTEDPRFHTIICSQTSENWRFTRTAVLQTTPSELAQRTEQVVRNRTIAISPTYGGSGKIELDIRWGDKEGPTVSVSGKAEVHDNKGNSVDIKVEQKDDGTGNVTISASHKEENEE
ncbi:MAG TPA: hypothetical protein VHL30_05115 [Chlamydiales bacterium]|jgi:hypothetical protein|nr:hypothetical protein [Chlamydiales bacterium]